MISPATRLLIACIAAVAVATIDTQAMAQDVGAVGGKSPGSPAAKPKDRVESIRAVLSRLGLGEGSVIADIGAGSGRDSWVFASIVGKKGTVFAEEIFEGKVKSLKKEAEKKKLSQVRAVLGHDDGPGLPPGAVDMAFMHYVYHHVTKPREMLRGIWRSLKPGGYLVVVDQRRGTLRDWVPQERRGKKHFWIAETTIVREAREEGFNFTACPDDYWYKSEPFVLIFKRPKELKSPGHDPDPFLPLPLEKSSHLFLPLGRPYQQPAFVALGEARKLLGPILRHSSGPGIDIVLEEWATQKDERPPLPENVSLPSVLTDNGDPHLESGQIDVVFFLDSYHLLFHGKVLLARIYEKLAPSGCICVLDRKAREPLPRREASHRREIRPETVKREMAEAGFFLWFRGPCLSPDRFLLVFGKTEPGKISPEVDPFVAGPTIPHPPARWLRENYWRLRGLKTTGGELLRFAAADHKKPVEVVSTTSSGKEICRLANEKSELCFEKQGEVYQLTNYRSLNP